MRRRRWAAWVTVSLAACVISGVAANAGAPPPPGQRSAVHQDQASVLRHQLKVERARADRTLRAMRRALLARPSVNEAIHLAAITYGVDEGRMRTIIWRESRFRPWAKNPHSTASGLAQFLSGTWASTPQAKAGLSVFSAYANAMGMAWYVAHHGWGAWAQTNY